jgi:diguanylate cyclase (GGDEF)-like protein/PAS domain S-box-containing protein
VVLALLRQTVVNYLSVALGRFLEWAPPDRILEFFGLIVGAILTATAARPRARTSDWAIVPPSFVIEFAALLLLGPNATLLVVAVATIVQVRAHPLKPLLSNAVTVMAAVTAAGFAYQWSGGTTTGFVWPWQGVPIAVAVVTYCIVKSASAEIVAPLFARRPINRSWPRSVLMGCPNYFIGASLAVGLVEVIDHQLWGVLPVAALPLYFGYHGYRAHVNRVEEEHRRSEIGAALDQGVAVVDSNGKVTLWNEVLERILGCPRERALGRSVVDTAAVLATTDLSRAITGVLTDRTARTVAVRLSGAASAQVLRVRILPGVGEATLLWDDVTEHARATEALKRNEERLALAAVGANDGLWAWDLLTNEFYCSDRWRAMSGLSAGAGIGRVQEWTERVHPDDLASLKGALDAHLSGKTDLLQHEHRIRHEDGTYRRFLCRGIAERPAGRRPTRVAGSLTETTDRESAPERGHGAASSDPLTGLCNRAVFVEGLGRRLDDLKRQGGSRFAVCYLDLDRFKVVNDNLGHRVGDELLTTVSRRLESCLRPGDALTRLDGDEFAILLNKLEDPTQANAAAFRIQDALSPPFSIDGREVFTSASIGIAFSAAHYSSADEILRDADTAMSHAKSHGKARHELFDADMHAREQDRVGLESDLRRAVKNNDFEVHYQPIVLLATGRCVGFESLIRWTRNGKPISPVTFIPLAEELGIIAPLGTWVLQQACDTFADWKRRFPANGLDYITVNVSSRQLMQQNFLLLVEQAVDHAGLQPCDLRLEITETALMDSPQEAAKLLGQLREFGAKIYLDDFGCGYSSLSHLAKLPVDALKIDRSFVNSLLLPDRPAIVESILALARTLKTSVVAEGIEDEAQARQLKRLGCTHAQGYLFSRPLSTSAVEDLLVANQPLGPKKARAAAVAEDTALDRALLEFAAPCDT